jgi:hypothetical protein
MEGMIVAEILMSSSICHRPSSHTTIATKSLKMTPFEVLHKHRCRTPLNWIGTGEKAIFCLDLIDEVEATVYRIQDNLKAVKSPQKSYANKRR